MPIPTYELTPPVDLPLIPESIPTSFPTETALRSGSLGVSQEISPSSLSTPDRPPSMRERITHSRIGRTILATLTTASIFSGMTTLETTPAMADSYPVYTMTNHDNDGTNGFYARRSPHWSDSARQLPYYAWYGDRIQLICGTNGDPVGPYQNHRWHRVRNLNNPDAGEFYVDDHDTNTPNKANEPTPGEAECDTPASAPSSGQTSTQENPWDTPATSEHTYVDHVVWADTPFGKSLHVYMTGAGYLKSFMLPGTAFAEVMRDAHLPNSGSMYNQFLCHADIAPPWKKSWNLDTWRPDVGLEQTIIDKCNPQPGEQVNGEG